MYRAVGRLGRKQSSLSKEQTDNERDDGPGSTAKVIPRGVEESRCEVAGDAAGSFGFAQDDGVDRSRRRMNGTSTTLPRRSFGETMRADVWWLNPLLVFLGLGMFVVYSTWAAFQSQHYYFGNYISPFYSPELFGNSPHSWFGSKPLWWPAWLIFSPALL